MAAVFRAAHRAGGPTDRTGGSFVVLATAAAFGLTSTPLTLRYGPDAEDE